MSGMPCGTLLERKAPATVGAVRGCGPSMATKKKSHIERDIEQLNTIIPTGIGHQAYEAWKPINAAEARAWATLRDGIRQLEAIRDGHPIPQAEVDQPAALDLKRCRAVEIVHAWGKQFSEANDDSGRAWAAKQAFYELVKRVDVDWLPDGSDGTEAVEVLQQLFVNYRAQPKGKKGRFGAEKLLAELAAQLGVCAMGLKGNAKSDVRSILASLSRAKE